MHGILSKARKRSATGLLSSREEHSRPVMPVSPQLRAPEGHSLVNHSNEETHIPMSNGESDEITFVFENADEAPTIAVTGAYGGPSPDGASVVANLYVERSSIPHHVSHQIDEQGQVNLDEMSEQVTRGEVTREVQASLVMTPEHALQLAQWLQQNAQQALKQRDQNYG